MELIGLLFKIFVVLIVIYAVHRSWKFLRDLNNIFENLERARNGNIHRRCFFNFPKLILEHRGVNIQISIALATGGDVLIAKMYIFKQFKSIARIYLLPSNAIERFGAKIGLDNIKTGNRAFDQAYIVKAKPAGVASVFLNPDIQQALLMIRDLSPEIEVTQTYTLFKTNVFQQTAEYDRLLKAAFAWIESSPSETL